MTAGVDRVTVESADETRLHVSVFPAILPAAALVVVHGLKGHAGWMEASGTGHYLAQQSVVTFAFDRRGSGRSAGERGHADRQRVFFDDLRAVRELVATELVGRRNADAPVHLLAHSFGARIALPYVMENPDQFDSIILTSPATHMAKSRDWGLIDRLRILASPPSRRFDIPIPDEDFVEPGVWLDWLRDDHRTLRACTAAFLRSAASLVPKMNEAIGTLRHPLLVLTAANDRQVRNEEIESTFRGRYQGPLKLLELPGAHQVDFTESQPAYREALTRWFAGGWQEVPERRPDEVTE